MRFLMKKFHLISLIIFSGSLMACASNVKPTYVSPSKYQSLDCSQLQAEYQRLEDYIKNGVESSSTRTGVGVGIGLGGGWGSRGGWGLAPSISINMGQSSNTKRSETARLLGEQDALAQASRFKNCPTPLKMQSEKQAVKK